MAGPLLECFLFFVKFTAARFALGRPLSGACPRRMILSSFLGHPPGGTPRTPENISTTELGNETSCFSSSFRMSAGRISLAIRKSVVSPTTYWTASLDDVANSRFTSAYIFSASRQRWPKPMAVACSRKFVYWPPGIFVLVEARRAGLGRGIERQIIRANRLPVSEHSLRVRR